MNIKKSYLVAGVILILVVLASLYSIDAKTDNIKSFEKGNLEYGRIGIDDKQNKKLADYTLLKNTDQCLTDCSAEGKAVLYKKGVLFTDLNFKNKKGDSVGVESGEIFILVSEKYEEEVNEYEVVCDNNYEKEILFDGLEPNCHYEVIESHIETKYRDVWEEYNGEVLDAGEYEWRIEGEKNINENIDWIVSSFGVNLEEWAWWNSDWKKCRNIEISTNLIQDNAILEANLEGLTFTNTDEIRIVNAPCNENGNEVKSTVLKSGDDWAYVTFLADLNGVDLTYSVYYDNPSNPVKDEELVDDFCEFDNDCGWYKELVEKGDINVIINGDGTIGISSGVGVNGYFRSPVDLLEKKSLVTRFMQKGVNNGQIGISFFNSFAGGGGRDFFYSDTRSSWRKIYAVCVGSNPSINDCQFPFVDDFSVQNNWVTTTLEFNENDAPISSVMYFDDGSIKNSFSSTTPNTKGDGYLRHLQLFVGTPVVTPQLIDFVRVYDKGTHYLHPANQPVMALGPEEFYDGDEDGVSDSSDNCPSTFNPLQEDDDLDNIGDVCDNCIYNYNPSQTDTNEDGIGNACDFSTDVNLTERVEELENKIMGIEEQIEDLQSLGEEVNELEEQVNELNEEIQELKYLVETTSQEIKQRLSILELWQQTIEDWKQPIDDIINYMKEWQGFNGFWKWVEKQV